MALLLASIFAATLPSAAAEDPAVAVAQPYGGQRREAITHEVDFAVVVTPPYRCQVLKVWLPLPPSDDIQQVTTESLTSFPMELEPQIHTEPVYGNRFAYFEFHRPQGAQIIRHRFSATVGETNWNVDPEQVQHVAAWPAEFAPYLAAAPIADAEQFGTVIDEFRRAGKQAAGDLLGAMQWIEANMMYDHAHASLKADADFAFRERRGHCSDYHGLCATMGRALGYPTRVTYGLALFPKNSPSHCKVEVYLPPYGWVSFDLSESQQMLRALETNQQISLEQRRTWMQAVRDRLFSGFRENSWLLLTRGSNYSLVPAASRPVHVVRTIYAEADGQPLPEPDPANRAKREFAWMTAHRYQADQAFHKYTDLKGLCKWLSEPSDGTRAQRSPADGSARPGTLLPVFRHPYPITNVAVRRDPPHSRIRFSDDTDTLCSTRRLSRSWQDDDDQPAGEDLSAAGPERRRGHE